MKKHGLGKYQKDGCRCEICTEAKSQEGKRNRPISDLARGQYKQQCCPRCPAEFYTDEAYRAHYKLAHR